MTAAPSSAPIARGPLRTVRRDARREVVPPWPSVRLAWLTRRSVDTVRGELTTDAPAPVPQDCVEAAPGSQVRRSLYRKHALCR
ncbi:hypothetical protein IFM12275_38170 [Nocardia sputorum]|nr:hypothetical protein IFM12275_38170 [Nocardia sputorum]